MLKFCSKTKILFGSLNGGIISTSIFKRDFSKIPIRTSIFNNQTSIPKRMMMIKIEGEGTVKKELTNEEKQKIKEKKKKEQIERNALKKQNRAAMIERSKELKKTKKEKDIQSNEKKSQNTKNKDKDDDDDYYDEDDEDDEDEHEKKGESDEIIDFAEGDGETYFPKKEKVKVKPNKKKPNNDKGFRR
ncbi:hypothetical protein DDB_G0271534 [Dictyostelium discoideum AX4]|uniref:Uncharacterized protein n=1 Tax=Dictyostelium discoideum TaxID=44689 RepID=Q86JI0_DICDI|nr:hypothetical protein DDB_G0271534 [Dictyostelium discoideum AX4]EAL71631.1 hypothetical protein DDB_G0271534 [Dictyostelium discoideum AX4]|eukprot:XP_645571.1 hypothetical protein DDB_G0271534 [Dictyostelium discoideum AX4]